MKETQYIVSLASKLSTICCADRRWRCCGGKGRSVTIRTLTISLKTVGKLSDISCQDIHGVSLYAPLALKQTYEVYFGYDCTLRKYGRFRQKLPVKTDFRKNSARRRPVTGRSPRTGEEAQWICSYSEQVRPEAFIIGSVCCFSGMIYPHIQRPDPVNRSMNDQQRIH